MKNEKIAALCGGLLLMSGAIAASEPEEQLVIATRNDKTVVPGVVLKRPADFLLQRLRISNDDVKKITGALGGDYRVITRGLDKPIQWVRSGTLDVTIFVPYEYDVVPTSISAYTHLQAGDDD